MNKVLTFFLIPVALLLSGCGSTKIGRILADPSRYHSRNVTVEGNVTNVVGAFVAGLYQVEDETGKIYVLSSRGVPTAVRTRRGLRRTSHGSRGPPSH